MNNVLRNNEELEIIKKKIEENEKYYPSNESVLLLKAYSELLDSKVNNVQIEMEKKNQQIQLLSKSIQDLEQKYEKTNILEYKNQEKDKISTESQNLKEILIEKVYKIENEVSMLNDLYNLTIEVKISDLHKQIKQIEQLVALDSDIIYAHDLQYKKHQQNIQNEVVENQEKNEHSENLLVKPIKDNMNNIQLINTLKKIPEEYALETKQDFPAMNVNIQEDKIYESQNILKVQENDELKAQPKILQNQIEELSKYESRDSKPSGKESLINLEDFDINQDASQDYKNTNYQKENKDNVEENDANKEIINDKNLDKINNEKIEYLRDSSIENDKSQDEEFKVYPQMYNSELGDTPKIESIKENKDQISNYRNSELIDKNQGNKYSEENNSLNFKHDDQINENETNEINVKYPDRKSVV